MPDYHVGCGAFGIYAGTLEPRNKNMWRNKSAVTDEAILSVVQYFKQELQCKQKTKFHTQYSFTDGTLLDFDIHISEKREDEAGKKKGGAE